MRSADYGGPSVDAPALAMFLPPSRRCRYPPTLLRAQEHPRPFHRAKRPHKKFPERPPGLTLSRPGSSLSSRGSLPGDHNVRPPAAYFFAMTSNPGHGVPPPQVAGVSSRPFYSPLTPHHPPPNTKGLRRTLVEVQGSEEVVFTRPYRVQHTKPACVHWEAPGQPALPPEAPQLAKGCVSSMKDAEMMLRTPCGCQGCMMKTMTKLAVKDQQVFLRRKPLTLEIDRSIEEARLTAFRDRRCAQMRSWACTLLSRVWRGRLQRVRHRELMRRRDACLKIQRLVRGVQGRHKFRVTKLRRTVAAIKIQSVERGAQDRQRTQQWQVSRQDAAIKLQSHARKRSEIVRFQLRLESKQNCGLHAGVSHAELMAFLEPRRASPAAREAGPELQSM